MKNQYQIKSKYHALINTSKRTSLVRKKISSGIRLITLFPLWFYLNHFAKNFFLFQGKKYLYNRSWKKLCFENSRTIEVPLGLKYLKKFSKKNILEIGNTLQSPIKRDTIDKYEEDSRIINEDIIYFKPCKRYDLIISISTFEHIGYDEEVFNPKKVFLAFKKAISLLNNGGKFIFTVPLGYNPYLDNLLESGYLKFDNVTLLKKLKPFWKNSWKEVPFSQDSLGNLNPVIKKPQTILVGEIVKK